MAASDSSLARRTDLAVRAVLVLAALLAALLRAPSALAGGLIALALVASLERLGRSRENGAADFLLLLVGGTLTTLVLVGVVLGATPIGLSDLTWELGLGLVALAALVVAAFLPRPAPLPRALWANGARAVPWVAGVAVVIAVAVTISVRSVGPAERPPLQMSFGKIDGNKVEVVVTSAEKTPALELRTTQGGDEISYPLFTVGADKTYRTTVALPRTGRYVVSVNYPDQSQPLRTLILDR